MRPIVWTLSCWLMLASHLVMAQEQTTQKLSPEDVQFFEKDVLPILKANCFKCHGGQPKAQADFRITSRVGILKGGELGPVIDETKPEQSLLLQAVGYGGDLKMPPTGKLSADKIAVLTKWVKLGLPWSSTADYGVEPEKKHDGSGDAGDYWAYQPIKRPTAPRVKNTSWVKSPVDAFVLSKLEAKGLSPRTPADNVALVRRTYYDLTGLPPAIADVETFLKDDSPNAYEKLIDRLLDSPQYGEKWGRHWLDLVRYAESHGYERDSAKPEAWRFRDYVINSFNQDKPYDRFLIEQLAGDELDEVTRETLTATGYYRLGIWDDEPADPLLARYDGLDDIVKTTAEVMLGISMGCARCHEHRGDPIPHADYYRMLAYFHDITHPNAQNLRHLANDADRARHAQLLQAKADQEAQWQASIREIEATFRVQLHEKLGLKLAEADRTPDGDAILLADSRKQGQRWYYSVEKPSDDWMQPDYSTTSWKEGEGGFGVRGTPGAVVRTEWRSNHIWLRRDFDLKELPKAAILDLHHDEDVEVYLNGFLIHSAKGFLTEYQKQPLKKPALRAFVKGRNVLAIHCRHSGGGQYVDAGLIASEELDLIAALKQHGEAVLGREKLQKYTRLVKELEDSKKTKLPDPGTPIMSVKEAGQAQTFVLLRGNPHSKGQSVEPNVPAMLKTKAPELPTDKTKHGTSGKRLAFAKWLVAPDNPLTARVIANRIWQHHFGRAIVPTPNDFGMLGEQPTHPELLDWLASEIVAGGWKLKRMHKLLMLSATYQQSSLSAATPVSAAANDVATVDPSNALLWRMNSRRLTSEEIRDSMLFVTGELNLKSGGPSVYVSIPAEVLAGQSRPGAGWSKSSAEDEVRRSVYIHLKRSLLVPILEMHDQADTDSSCPVRYNTVVPTQSLGMLNGEFTNEKAGRLAARLKREAGDHLATQVGLALQLITARIPSNDEITSDVNFIRALQTRRQLTAEQALRHYCLLMLNTNEFVYVD